MFKIAAAGLFPILNAARDAGRSETEHVIYRSRHFERKRHLPTDLGTRIAGERRAPRFSSAMRTLTSAI